MHRVYSNFDRGRNEIKHTNKGVDVLSSPDQNDIFYINC